MKGDKNVIEYLNKALRHELTAVNQYWLHYRLLDNWGYKVLARTWRNESIEEMQHADKLIERIIFLDGSPNMQTLESLHIGKTVKAVLDNDLQAELSAHSLYAEAATQCHSVKDYVTRDLFEQLMHDEEEHIDFLETQIELVARIGLELYAQRHVEELDEDLNVNDSIWPIGDEAARLMEVCSVGYSRLDLLTLSSSHFDPQATSSQFLRFSQQYCPSCTRDACSFKKLVRRAHELKTTAY
jgi:bacterioferritin